MANEEYMDKGNSERPISDALPLFIGKFNFSYINENLNISNASYMVTRYNSLYFMNDFDISNISAYETIVTLDEKYIPSQEITFPCVMTLNNDLYKIVGVQINSAGELYCLEDGNGTLHLCGSSVQINEKWYS